MAETFILGEEELSSLAFKVVEELSLLNKSGAKVILLEGDLGAGKTTFAKELGFMLGIDKRNINSPTFILKKEHKSDHNVFKKLIHIDAYRFDNPSESKVLRLNDDLSDDGNLIVIEWPSKMNYVKSDMNINFSYEGDDKRKIVIDYDKD